MEVIPMFTELRTMVGGYNQSDVIYMYENVIMKPVILYN
jgi:hypothetical protein